MISILICLLIVILECYSLIYNSGIRRHKYSKGWIGYYTTLSNILVLVYHLGLWLHRLHIINIPLVENRVVSLSVTLAIILTFLIYHFLLSETIKENYKKKKSGLNHYSLHNLSLHYFCPILTLINWYFFANKEGLKVLDGLYWIVLPYAYLIFVFVRVKLDFTYEDGRHYPYDFMDFEKYGTKKCILNLIVLSILFASLGLLISFIGTL